LVGLPEPGGRDRQVCHGNHCQRTA
jgi:hypothetical protein